MPLDITCQYCGKNYRISDEVAGKNFRCVGCRKVLKAPSQSNSATSIRSNVAGPNPKLDSIAGPTQRPTSKSPGNKRGERREPPRNQTRKQRPTVPDDDDYLNEQCTQDDPLNYHETFEASWNEMPGGPVGQPKPKHKVKSNARQVTQRSSNPEAFAEYDRIMNEVAVFWIGLAVIVGGFAVLMSTVFWDGAGDQARFRTIIQWQTGIAISMFVVGLITFTKSKIWLYSLFFICALFMLANFILAIVAGCFLWIPFFGFCLLYVSLGKALSAHP